MAMTLRVFNNACHKNMYKYIFMLLSFLLLASVDVFIFHYVYEWMEREIRDRFSGGTLRCIHPSLLIEGGYFFRSWNFACLENNTRHVSEKFFFEKRFMFCHFHVSHSEPFPRKRSASCAHCSLFSGKVFLALMYRRGCVHTNRGLDLLIVSRHWPSFQAAQKVVKNYRVGNFFWNKRMLSN